MIHLINEGNSDLNNRKFPLTKGIRKLLKRTLEEYTGDKTVDGYKRLNNLLGMDAVSYVEMKRLKNFFDTYDGTDKSAEYVLNGGDAMKTWVNNTLGTATAAIRNYKRAKKDAGMSNAFIKHHQKDRQTHNSLKPTQTKVNAKNLGGQIKDGGQGIKFEGKSRPRTFVLTEEQVSALHDSGLLSELKGNTRRKILESSLIDERWDTVPATMTRELPNESTPPKQFILNAYKLVRVDPSSREKCVYPLFVNAEGENREKWYIGRWYAAGEGEHKIEIDDVTGQPTGRAKVTSKLGNLAYRPGLHFGTLPYAPHIYSKKTDFFNKDVDGWVTTDDGQTVYGDTARKYKAMTKAQQKQFKQNFDYSRSRAMKPYTAWAYCEISYSEDDQTEATNNGNYVNGKGKVVNNARNSMLQKLPKYGYRYKTNSNAPDNQTWYISNMMRIVRILSDDEVRQILSKEGIKALDRTEYLDLSYLRESKRHSGVLKESVNNFDVDNVNSLSFTVDKYKYFDEEGFAECDSIQEKENYIRSCEWFEGEVYDNNGHHLEWFEGDRNDVEELFGKEVAEEMFAIADGKDSEGTHYIQDINTRGSDSIDLDNAEDVNAFAKRLSNGGPSEYLLTDGSLISLYDHNQISQIGGMTPNRFMSYGNIRLGGGSIEVAKMPTNEQLYALRQWIDSNPNQTIYLDIAQCQEDGNYPKVLHGTQYYLRKNGNRIVNDIVRYFDDGIKPLGESKKKR